jgi:hypothetical protein
MEFYHMPKLSVEGKTIQEVISKVLVYGFADRWVNIGKNRIDTLYEDFNDGTKTKKDMDKIFPILHEVMSTTNFVIENSKSKDFWKKRDIMILMIIIWDLARTKKKFDSTLLRGGYMKVISDLKNKNSKLNDWAIENGYLVKNAKHEDNQLPESIRERDNTFASTYVAGDSPITLQFVIETIKSKLFEVGIIKSRDGRRVFTKEEKQQKAHLQDCECACCHEPIDVDNTSSYEGDHIIPHSEGGKTELSNCEALCIECHQLKTTQFKSYKKLREKYNSLSTK